MITMNHIYLRQNFKTKVVCLNCGKIGHNNKTCRYPTNSYGCIVYKKSKDEQIRYLLIQRKYTPEYIELIRGRYFFPNQQNDINQVTPLNYQYLIMLITDLPIIERYYIIQYGFNYLWNNIWQWIGTDEQMYRINSDYNECERRFNLLKKGHYFEQYGYISFQTLFNNYNTHIIEPNWEFPKGKRRIGENDQQCAIRECCEETSLNNQDFNIYLHIQPFQETFIGINSVKYCNSYYISVLTNEKKLLYYDPSHLEQNKEIRKIGWFTKNEIEQLINPKYTYRLNMIHNVDKLVHNLDTF